MILYGASGHGKAVAEIIREITNEGVIFFDDNEFAALPKEIVVAPSEMTPEESVIVTIGMNHVRYEIVTRRGDYNYAKAIHPRSFVSKSATIGSGTVVMATAVLSVDCEVGDHVIVNTGAIVEHDCVIKAFSHISPNAVICGGVEIGEGTWIGAGATIKNGLKIGKWVVIGAGAVVISDVPDYSIFVGCPAVFLSKNDKFSH